MAIPTYEVFAVRYAERDGWRRNALASSRARFAAVHNKSTETGDSPGPPVYGAAPVNCGLSN